MSSEFDRAMRLTPRHRGDDDVQAATELTRDWTIGEAINGGVLMALAGTALGDLLGGAGAGSARGHADPLALSAHFLSAATPGPASVVARALRRGRSVSTGQASVVQPGSDGDVRECMRVLATYGHLPDDPPVHRSIAPPTMPSPQECLGRDSVVGGLFGEVPLGARADLRFDPQTAGWATGRPSMTGTLRAWWRFADGREPDVIALLFALDALPPVAFDLGVPGWAPTLEFSAHLRGRPAPGWLRILVRSENLIGDLLEEDVWIWDSRDRLVAQSRQLARVRLPDTRVPTGR